MKYASAQEKQFVNDAIKKGTYRIDYAFGQVLKLSIDGLSYMHDFSFYGLGVTSKNSERFIIRALYRAI